MLGSIVTEFCLRPAPGAGVTNLPAAVLNSSHNSSASLGIPALGVSLRSWLLQQQTDCFSTADLLQHCSMLQLQYAASVSR